MHVDHENRDVTSGLSCAACGHQPVATRDDGDVVCPNCEERYSLIRHEEFAMMESDGWIARISIGPTVDAMPGVANG